MLYSVLPGLSLCMTLFANSTNVPQVNVAFDTNNGIEIPQYNKYLDAAMILIRAAKELRNKQESSSEESNQDPLEETESEIADRAGDDASSVVDKDDSTKEILNRCPLKPIDCEEILIECGYNASGVYKIYPRSRIETWGHGGGFDVYCDMVTDGGGWTVFQRRDDFGTNSDFFYKDWQSYKFGFGNLYYDFWLGNDKIFALSSQRDCELRFDLLDFENVGGFALYDHFYIDDENEGYRLHLGDYRGSIGDSFSGHNRSKFSTKDRDNDNNSARNCAQTYKGGWWYNNCHTVNLNGMYHKGTHNSYADGINWYGWRGFKYSLKMTEMKLRSDTFRRTVNFAVSEESEDSSE
ncbi:techylectin-5A-like [Uloborus diversus]|uniref:techylectin-5A-like n=1 Tax=Uloborus diversus TaxID=327109 RepID=UPI0024091605|nr:techylectin-5A-like [Uloborus diversus]